MDEGMSYDPIRGQGQGHDLLEVLKSVIFKVYLLRHFITWIHFHFMKLDYRIISKIDRAGFLISITVTESRDLKHCSIVNNWSRKLNFL